MFQPFQMRDIIFEILNLPEADLFRLNRSKERQDKNLDLYIVTFVMDNGKIRPNWHLENHESDLYIVYDNENQRRELLNTKIVDGNPELEDSAKKTIAEAIRHSVNTLATVIMSILQYSYLYDMQKSKQYKEVYPSVAPVYTDNDDIYGIEVSVGDDEPHPIESMNSPYRAMLYTPVDELNDVDIDAGYYQKVVVGKNPNTNEDQIDLKHLKLFNIKINDGVIAFTRYTYPRKDPMNPRATPRQYQSTHTNRVSLSTLNLTSNADVDDEDKIIKHSLTSWINSAVNADTKITDNLSENFSRKDTSVQILCTEKMRRYNATSLIIKNMSNIDPNHITEAERIAIQSKLKTDCIVFDTMYNCYKAHDCEPVISARMSAKGVAIQYSTTKHDKVATLYVDVDPIYLDQKKRSLTNCLMPVYGDTRPTIVYDDGNGNSIEIEPKSLRMAMDFIRDLMVYHLIVNDIKTLGKYIFVESLDNPLSSDEKLVVKPMYHSMSKFSEKPFTKVIISTLTNPKSFQFLIDVHRAIATNSQNQKVTIPVVDVSYIENDGTLLYKTEFSAHKNTNIYDIGVDYEKSLRSGRKKPANVAEKFADLMLKLSDKNQYSNASGKLIDAGKNQQSETENILRVRNDELLKKMIAVREAFVNTFGRELTEGSISKIFAVTDQKTKNLALEFRVDNGSGGIFSALYINNVPTAYCQFTNALSKPLEPVTNDKGQSVLDQGFVYWYLFTHGTNSIAQRALRMMQYDNNNLPENVVKVLEYGRSQRNTSGKSLREDFDDILFDEAAGRGIGLEDDYYGYHREDDGDE